VTVRSAWDAIRQRWRIVATGTVVGALVGLLVAVITPPTYAATTSIYVSARNTSGADEAYQGGLMSLQRVQTYQEIVRSTRVLQPAGDDLQPPVSADDLAERVTASSSADSALLTISAEGSSPRAAADAANAVADRFMEVVAELESSGTPDTPAAVDMRIVDRAVPSAEVVSPQVGLDVAVGLIFGLLAGLAGALIAGSARPRVRSATLLSSATGAPVLGVLPRDRRFAKRGNRAVVPEGGAHREAVRSIRTNLFFVHAGVGARHERSPSVPTNLLLPDSEGAGHVLAVTSAVPREGKTTFVCSLAAALAPTYRVLVLEGDLRRPVLAERLGLATAGLTDVLAGRIDVQAAIQEWGDVVVLVGGGPHPAPSEALVSRRAGEVLADLRARYDLVLIDCPPLLAVSDAALLASRADGTVLLCRRSAWFGDVERATQVLAAVDARTVGCVLTMDRTRRRRYAYDEPAVPEQTYDDEPSTEERADQDSVAVLAETSRPDVAEAGQRPLRSDL
jgi:capsular exopolysaccharide synthesis family protein